MQTKVLEVIYLVIYVGTSTLQHLLHVWKQTMSKLLMKPVDPLHVKYYFQFPTSAKVSEKGFRSDPLSWCTDGLLAEALASHKKSAMKNTLSETWKIQA